MNPRVFLDGFWRNDILDEVFVAMSFDPKYEDRWEDILKPAIESQPFGELSFKAIRVDIRKSGDSILTEINNGIAHAQLVLVDISVTDTRDSSGHPRRSRNGNVMYEVGIALTCRQPVEVVLVRDDSESLLFDISHIPVLKFDPHDTEGSVTVIRKALADRLHERDLMKDLRVKAFLESLSQFEINLIRSNAHLNFLGWRGPSYPPAVGISLPRILEKRVLRLAKLETKDNPDIYTWTTLGRVVANFLKRQERAT